MIPSLITKTTLTLSLALGFVSTTIKAQTPLLKSPPAGGNKKAFIGERIGITDVVINYDRPGVKGREDHIYGTPVVHTGYVDKSIEYGTATKAPWRAGANENTTIEFSTDVIIEGKALAAGKYGFFVAYDPKECVVIFSKDHNSWGNYFYDEKNDALRVTVKTIASDKSVEWLKYEFTNQTENSATIALQWEKVMIPFKVEVDLVKTTLDEYREKLKGELGFRWESWNEAAGFCLKHNTNFEEGSKWAEFALASHKDFETLNNKAQYLIKEGKPKQADSLMKEASTIATMMELHFYGRRLVDEKQNTKALDVFKLNAKKYPKNFTTYVGLARGYSATGDFKAALVNAKAALPLSPNEPNKAAIEAMIKKLENNKDIN